MKKKIVSLLCAGLLACGLAAAPFGVKTLAAYERAEVHVSEKQFEALRHGDLLAVFETSMGTITVVLYDALAPIAVDNFRRLAEDGYYDGTVFHRVVKDFVVQGGDPTGTGTGGESHWGVPFKTEAREGLRHYSGALCMAGAGGIANTHNSQFYFVATPPGNITETAIETMREAGVRESVIDGYNYAGGLPYLDNTDTVFGQVYMGMDVVDAIAGAATGEDDRPAKDVKILSVTLERYEDPDYVPPEEADEPEDGVNEEGEGPAGE